ncbi:MAG: efflux RND transporter permease subunit [Candidatus Aminicenantaceae bacterium]
MLSRIFNFSLKQRIFIVLVTIAVASVGLISYQRLSIDVFPDPSPVLVQVYTEAEGMAPEEVERLISYPLESSMFGLPNVKNIRSLSTFALSMISVYFKDGTDIYWARQLVSQRLLEVKEILPVQARNPVLGPVATGLGLVYLYYLDGEGYSPLELRTVQDWLVKYELKSVPEVTQVLSIGGDVKQYQILVNPNHLLKYNLTISDLIVRIKKNNQNVGASFITKGKEEYIVRSVGLIQTKQDIEHIVVTGYQGTPVYVKDVASVEVLPAIKRGTALADGKGEKVVGMVLKLFGSNTARLINNIEERISEINKSLPSGVKIVPFYNQASLVKKCFSTVSTNLMLGIILVILILFLFMGNIWAALIAVCSLPFSILFTFILMDRINLTADLMSFGGLAISIGLIADAAIIFVENAHRHIQAFSEDKIQAITSAGREVGRPLFFAIAIIILVFLPIFTLQGVEGIMFRPMGYTISFAMAGSLIFSIFFVPALSYLLLKRKKNATKEPFLTRNIKKAYLPLFVFCQKHRKKVFLSTIALFLVGLFLIPFLGREYIPYLEEGTLHLRVTLDPNISLQETISMTTSIEKALEDIPEITGILSRIGRGEVGSHAHFVNNAEILIQLKPIHEWKSFKDKNELLEEIEHRLGKFPGLILSITQPIAHNLDELITGVKAQLAIKIYGEDFDVLEAKSMEIKDIISSIKGAAGVQIEQFTGQNQVQIVLDREKIARYGINIADVQETIKAAVGGITIGQVYEQQKKFDIFLRFEPEYRKDIEKIENLLIRLPTGGQIPLKLIASLQEVIGSRLINRENNRRYITIQCNIRKRDIGRFVDEAQKRIEENIDLPPEYFIKWGGQFELQQQANKRLLLITPLTLCLVAILLFTIFYSFREMLIILINIPFALVGGIIALKISGLYLSIPASIGFIAIFGIALEAGLVLLSHFNHLLSRGLSMNEAIIQGVNAKVRPVLMTTFTTIFGVLPLLLARGPGAEIQRPLATVVVGGLFTSTLVTLFVLPLVYQTFKKSSRSLK